MEGFQWLHGWFKQNEDITFVSKIYNGDGVGEKGREGLSEWYSLPS